MTQERVAEEPEVKIPLFYERFQEERDKRFSSEIARLEGEIRRNGQRLDELKADNASQHEELKAAIARLDSKIDKARDELKEDVARLDGKIDKARDELKGEIIGLRDEMHGEITGLRDELKGEITGLRDELKGESTSLRDELKGEMTSLRDELKGEIASLRREMQSTFRWMIGLLLPIIIGVVALLIQNLLKP